VLAVFALGFAVWPRIGHEEANRSADYYIRIAIGLLAVGVLLCAAAVVLG
jgi:hypothetical protein